MDQDQNQRQDQQQSTPKQSVVARVQQATNVLVTVRSNPTVDELSAAIGLTLMLNKLGKHATAVFSGAIPSTLEFLKPEDTIETNTDSLRDFIVSLDKSKADKLRYKVEENVVKIFITPYRTSITQDDLEFTQGDFNVDVVMALGVTQREELDQAITAHGRILHDATVITVTAGQHESQLGTINWQEAGASSLSEMLMSVSEAFQGGIIDEQMATAFLTGIVAETERFSNTKTSPKVMTMAAQLMAAGANQQLIANELQKVEELAPDQPVDVEHDQPAPPPNDDGSLSISHDNEQEPAYEDPDKDQPDTDDKPAEPDDGSEPVDKDAGGETFLPPLPVSEAGDSFEPLMPEVGGDAHDTHDAPDGDQPPADPVFGPDSEPAGQTDQIHIDNEGNLIQPGRPQQPKHNLVQPLGDAAPASQPAAEPSLDDELADLSALLKDNAPFGSGAEHPEVEDVKATSPGSALPEPAVPPEPDAPALPDTPEPVAPAFAMPPPPSEPEQPASLFDAPPPPATPAPPPPPVLPDETTLLDIEKTVHSPHLETVGEPIQTSQEHVDDARNAVQSAISQAGYDTNRPEPRTDLNAQPFSVSTPPAPQFEAPTPPAMNGFDPSAAPAEPELRAQTPGGMPLHTLGEVIPEGQNGNDTPAPPVPPPLMPMQ